MKSVILAGGHGTRLRPMSTQTMPKQFLKLFNDKSLIQNTVERILYCHNEVSDVFVSTNESFVEHLRPHLAAQGITNFILEPLKKNTAPAIALIVKYLEAQFGEDEVVFLLPSDHLVSPWKDFKKYIQQAEQIAKEGKIALFGIRPNKPETGYGYIKTSDKGEVKSDNSLQVEEFKEKPDFLTAQKYLMQGDYYRNSGMFMFSIKTIKQAFKEFWPDIGAVIDLSYDQFLAHFGQLQEISIDYAVMERAKNIELIPMNIIWSDVGSRDSVYENLAKDEQSNVLHGNIKTHEVSKSMIWSESGKKIIIDGFDDVILIETDDGIVLTRRGYSQNVGNLLSL